MYLQCGSLCDRYNYTTQNIQVWPKRPTTYNHTGRDAIWTQPKQSPPPPPPPPPLHMWRITVARLHSLEHVPDSKVHGTNIGPTWVLSALDGPHVGPMNLAIRCCIFSLSNCQFSSLGVSHYGCAICASVANIYYTSLVLLPRLILGYW